MRITHVKALRRALVGLIILVLIAVAVNWVQTWRARARVIQQAAEILSSEMIRSADNIEYSENENGVARFKLRAEKLLETRQGKSLLQGIEARDFNPDGSVRNQIRSRNAEYDREARQARFTGDVRIDMGNGVELRTESLQYDLANNTGQTEDRLQFISEQARGTATGARYDNARKILELKREVDFTFERPVARADGTRAMESVRVISDLGYYSESDQLILFRGNARLDTESATLAGNEIESRFSPDKKHITSLLSQGNAVYESKDAPERRTLSGDRIEFGIAQDSGALERIMIFGKAAFSSESEAGKQELRGSTIRLDLDVERGTPRRIESQSGVEFQIRRGSDVTVVTGNQLTAAFLPGSALLDAVRVWEGARMSMRGADAAAEDELRADELRIHFGNLEGKSVPRELQAERSVRWTSAPRKDASGRVQGARTLSSSALIMRYTKAGEVLESGTASGGVVLDGLQSGQQTRAQVRRLEADTVQFRFFPRDNRLKEFDGDGHVRVLYQRPPDAASDSPGDEIRTSSSKIRATFLEEDGTAKTVAQWGGFTYQDGSRNATAGRSDYDAPLEKLILRESPKITDESGTTTGEVVEYDQKGRILTVRRRVRSVLRPQRGSQATPFSSSSSSSPSVITADGMQAWTADSHARYSGNVQMLSENGQLQAQTLEVFDSGDRVEAEGEVRHLVPRRQAAAVSAPGATDGGEKKPPQKPAAPILIRSARLEYQKRQNVIQYSGGVTLQSDDIRMSAETMNAFFDSDGRRIERAKANGKLHIRQGPREVKGDEAEYLLTPGKFVVVGNLAEIQDPTRGRSQARRLTFFTSDDRIVLENH